MEVFTIIYGFVRFDIIQLNSIT